MTTSTIVTVDDLLANAAWARRLARNLLHDGDAADDLVQETWIAALKARPHREQPLRPWLGRVLRNGAINRGRDDARREGRHERTGALVAGASAADPEELVGRLQVQRLLAELITQLREPNRQTLLLRYYEGLTSEQIGWIMGVQPGTVRRRLKDAIDELRAELDRRHQGDREAWLGALLPLAPLEPATPAPTTTRDAPPASRAGAQEGDEPARATVTPPAVGSPVAPARAPAISPASGLAAFLTVPKLAIGVLAVALAAGSALLLRRPGGGGEPPGAGGLAMGTPGGAPRGGAPRGSGRQLAAALPGTLDQCRDTLAARRRELAPIEAEQRRNQPAEELYEQQTAPNPTARAALLPDLERAFRGDAGARLALDCRTLACRMTLEHAASESPRTISDWLRPLRTEPALAERVLRYSYRPGFAEDGTEGSSKVVVAFLRLKDPSGARVAGDDATGAASPAARPLPASVEACRIELEAAQRRLAFLKAAQEHDLPANARFARSQPNPALVAELGAVVARALQAGGVEGTPDVVCRGRVCQVSMPGASDASGWRGAVGRDPEFRRYVRSWATTKDGQVYYDLGDPQQPKATTMIVRALFAIEPGIQACEKRFPATGYLVLALVVPDGVRPDPRVEPGRITVAISGPLAEAPLGRCVGEEATRATEGIPLPPGVRGGSSSKRFDFPRAPGPVLPRETAPSP